MLIAMHSKGYSTGEMAKMLHVSRHSATGWLYGRHHPSHVTLEKWAEICRVPEDWLINGTMEETMISATQMKEQLAQALVAQLLGGESTQRRGYAHLSEAERDLAPIIDLTGEHAEVIYREHLAPTG